MTSTALAVVHRGVCHDEPPGSQGMTGGIRVRCGLGAVEEYEASSMGSVRWKRLFAGLRGLRVSPRPTSPGHPPPPRGGKAAAASRNQTRQTRTPGVAVAFLGVPVLAHTHLAQGIALYDPQQHRASAFLYGEDAGVFCWSQDARTLWHLGYPDQGRVRNDEAVTLAQQIAHPFSRSFALSAAAMFHQFRREVRAAQERVEAAIILAKEQGFPFWMAFGAMLRGWVLTQQGQAKEGIEQLNQGLMAFRATGVENIRPYFLGLLAEAY